jgi:hypothetical protein
MLALFDEAADIERARRSAATGGTQGLVGVGCGAAAPGGAGSEGGTIAGPQLR